MAGEVEAVPLELVAWRGSSYVGRAAPLRSAAGDVLGGVAAFRSHDLAEMAPFAGLRWAILAAGGAGLGVAFVLATLTGRSLAEPILALTRATRRVAEGDYDVAVQVEARDEIGTLAESIRQMITDLREKAVAGGRSWRGVAIGTCGVASSAVPRAEGGDSPRPMERGGGLDSTIARRAMLAGATRFAMRWGRGARGGRLGRSTAPSRWAR
ncbi:MAG: HAMP domain-containing protein [Gemmatimonadaceae bacterium]|nr:HAMP domain-containing protein [Gemmatimonadaceae bacterium]